MQLHVLDSHSHVLRMQISVNGACVREGLRSVSRYENEASILATRNKVHPLQWNNYTQFRDF